MNVPGDIFTDQTIGGVVDVEAKPNVQTVVQIVRHSSVESKTNVRNRHFRTLLVALPFVLLSFAVDVPVEYAISSVSLPSDLRRFVTVTEPFGHGCGVFLFLVGVCVLDPRVRHKVPRVAACAFGAGVIANAVKLLVARHRPRFVDLQTADVWQTFEGMLPLASSSTNLQSFPSAHTTSAVAFAVGLAYVYPRGRWFFTSLAVGVATQRMLIGAHFPSDVLCGAVVGFVWATYCVGDSHVGRFFDQIEKAWIARWGNTPDRAVQLRPHSVLMIETECECSRAAA